MTATAGLANRLVVDGEQTTWAELRRRALPDPAAVLCGPRDALAAIAQHAETGTELLLATPTRVDAAMRDELRNDGFHLLLDGHAMPPSAPRDPEPGRLWILTSGSTGRPKRIGHTLRSLTTVASQQPPRVWLCAYATGTYAWWQLVTLSLTQPGQELVVVDSEELDSWPRLAYENGVTAVSGTPTFWRQALFRHGTELRRLPLRQVTLGGEPVDQPILDRLHTAFPDARISWIYASSEVGAAIVVHDGRAGFPRRWLDRARPGRPILSVDQHELTVDSPHHGAQLNGPVRTGDRVELTADRVLIVGRRGDDEVNVGGAKIRTTVVRDVLHAHPAVAWARVRGRRAPIVGQVVVADVVVDGSVDDASLIRWAAERLPEYGVPRRLTRLDEIPAKETLKSDV